MTVRFSVVTVVLNDLDGLKQTQLNISKQVNVDYEWLVCDGGSDLSTINFLDSLGNQVRWVSEPDHGIYDAMNRGISMCTGDYVVFMNAGDTFHDSGTLAKVAKILSANNYAADMLFGGATLSFSGSGRSRYRPPRLAEGSLWHGLPANHQATFYRKKLLDITPYDLRYRLCGDYYLAATLMRNGAQAIYLNEPLATFEVGGQSYKNRSQLFIEPYLIQRDVLGMPFHYRLASVVKRLVSTVGFVLLSQSFFDKKNKGG